MELPPQASDFQAIDGSRASAFWGKDLQWMQCLDDNPPMDDIRREKFVQFCAGPPTRAAKNIEQTGV
jgi:hypothetical protein